MTRFGRLLALLALAATAAAQTEEPTPGTTTTVPTTTAPTTTPPQTATPSMRTQDGSLFIMAPDEIVFIEHEETTTRTLSSIVSGLQADIATAKSELSGTISNNVAAINNEVTGLKTSLASGLQQVTLTLTTNINTVSSAADTNLANAQSSLTTAINQLSSGAASQRAQLRADMQTADTSLQTAMNNADQSLGARVNALSTKVSTDLNAAKTTLSTSVAAVSTQLTSATASLHAKTNNQQTAINTIDAKLTATTNTANSNKQSVDNLNKYEANLKCDAAGQVPDHTGRCISDTTWTIQRGFPDIRTGSGWYDVAYRQQLPFYKKSAETYLHMLWTDTLGWYQLGGSKACQWEWTFDYRFAQRHQFSHSANHRGWRIEPFASHYFIHPTEGMSAGPHVASLRTHRSGGASECLHGWSSGSVENNLIFEEWHMDRMGITRYMADVRYGGAIDSWVSIPQRTVVYTPRESTSFLEIIYSDSMGTHQTGHTTAMIVRLLVNNQPYGKQYAWHSGASSGWRIHPTTLRWHMPKGTFNANQKYTFTLQWARYNGASELLAGWESGSTHNAFVVREQTNPFVAFSTATFHDRRNAQTGWSDIEFRSMSFTKKYPYTSVHVTYFDVLGYHQIAETTACRWRLLVNGGTANTLEHWTHSAGGYGWRILPKELTFYVNAGAIGAGTFTFRIQVVRAGGASECLAGWNSAGGFMRIEEIFEQ